MLAVALSIPLVSMWGLDFWISFLNLAVARSSGSKEGPMIADNHFRAVKRCHFI
jgi:hypothetical protein